MIQHHSAVVLTKACLLYQPFTVLFKKQSFVQTVPFLFFSPSSTMTLPVDVTNSVHNANSSSLYLLISKQLDVTTESIPKCE